MSPSPSPSPPTALRTPEAEGAQPAAAGVARSADRPLQRQLGMPELLGYGLTYIALVAPLSTLGFVWNASGGLITLAYLIGLICMAFTGFSYAAMAKAVPQAGSTFAYAGYALGPGFGFAAGWLLLLDYLLIPALVLVLMSVGLNAVAPGLDRVGWLAVLSSVTLAVNWWGITVTARVSQASVLVQVVFLLGLLVMCALALGDGVGQGALTLRPLWDAQALDWGKVIAGAGICMLSFLGFDAVATLSEEVKADSPEAAGRIVARAMLWVLAVAGVTFLIVTLFLGNLMPAVKNDDPVMAVFDLTEQLFGPMALAVVAFVLIWVVGFTNMLPMQAGVARLLFAMARAGRLPGVLSRLHARRGTPHVALLLSAVVSFGVAYGFIAQADLLTEVVNVGALGAFALLHLSVLAMWHRAAASERARWRWLAASAAIGLVLSLLILSQLSIKAQAVGLGWLLLGAWKARPSSRDGWLPH